MRGYYFITDAALSRQGNVVDVRDAVAAGVEVVQYRHKTAATEEMYNEASALRKICAGIIFLINDRIDIALAVGADGVHLGQEDMPVPAARKLLGKQKIIGVSVHSLSQALAAQKAGADYVAVAPVFATKTKTNAGVPRGVKLLRDIKKKLKIPVVAIGGITLANAALVIAAGADAVCAISCVVTSAKIKRQIIKFQHMFKTVSCQEN